MFVGQNEIVATSRSAVITRRQFTSPVRLPQDHTDTTINLIRTIEDILGLDHLNINPATPLFSMQGLSPFSPCKRQLNEAVIFSAEMRMQSSRGFQPVSCSD
jgi:hypothetical protein